MRNRACSGSSTSHILPPHLAGHCVGPAAHRQGVGRAQFRTAQVPGPAEGLGRFSIQRGTEFPLADVLIFPGPTVGRGTTSEKSARCPCGTQETAEQERERSRRGGPGRAGPRVSSDLRKLTSHGQASLGYSSHQSGRVWHVKLSQHEK